MSTYKVIEKLKALEQVLEESALHAILDRLANFKHEGHEGIRLDFPKDKFSRISSKEVFISIDKIKRSFEDIHSLADKKIDALASNEFKVFEDLYERYLEATPEVRKKEGLLDVLIWSARMLQGSLSHYLLIVRSIYEHLEQRQEHDSSVEEISLFFEYNYTLEETIAKLDAIQKLYSMLCHLMDVSEDDFPLKINVVETGSLLIKLLGETKVVEALLLLLKDASNFLYKNNTKQGKIESIPRKIETIEATVKLKKLLDENGIDTSQMTKNIEESAYIVTEQLSILLAGEKIVRINGEVISTTNKSVQKQLAGKETYLLKPAKGSEEESST